MEKLKVIITGSTGMVGEGAVMECLENPAVESVLVINRRSLGLEHPKLKEIIHSDFFDITPLESQLEGYNACFFCLGVSAVGRTPEDYFKTTHTLTLHWGTVLSRLNPDMTFCYISGAGTDSTEKGRMRWARVKGKTENDLMRLPFKRAFGVRPGFIKPTPGQQNAHKFYRYVNWLFPLGRAIYPKTFCTNRELARSMITLAREGYDKPVIEGDDIIHLGE